MSLGPDLVVFDGSGAALPPIATGRTIVVVGGHQDAAVAAGYLNSYRLLLADLVLVTMAEPDSDWERVRRAVAGVVRPDVAVVGTIPLVDTLLAVLLGAWILQEKLSPRIFFGGLLILVGVFLVAARRATAPSGP